MKNFIKIYKYALVLSIILLGCNDDEIVLEKKDALKNLTAISKIEAVTLQWDLPSEGVNNYIITYTPGDENLLVIDGTMKEVTIENLEPDVEYTFTISWLDKQLMASKTVSVSETPKIRPPGTYSGNLIIGNQSELDIIELPNQAALEIIDGNLTIISDGKDNTFDLSKLKDLKRVTGNVEIRNNPILSNLDNLSQLATIEGNTLTIENNRNLVNLCGLSNVPSSISSSISGNGFNPTLSDIKSGNCKTDDLIYTDFPRFNTQAELDALPDGITHFPGELVIGLDASTNDITDLSKFSKLRRIEGRLIIQRSPLLTDLTGFRSLEFIGATPSDELVIRQMDGLITLDGLQALAHVGRRIGIRENPVLQTLEGINNIRSIGENKINIGACGSANSGNPQLTDYCALTGIIERFTIPVLELGGSCIDSYSSFNPSFQDILDGNCKN